MKYSKIISAIVVGLTVAACNYETQVTLYSSDLTKDTEGTPLLAPVTLVGKGTFSEDDCEKIRGKVEPAVQRSFQNVEFKGCAKAPDGIDRTVSFGASVPVYVGSWEDKIGSSEFNGAYGLLTAYDQETPNVKKIIFVKGASYDYFTKELDNALPGSNMSKDGAGITLELNNDLSQKITFSGRGFFVNGTPYGNVGSVNLALPNRANIKVKLSDVAAQFLFTNGSEVIGAIDFASE
ncbi:hypothetical protein [Pseudovibrio sp. JE062]|uniref:DUF7424 family protein n=1 Tax=Pseudovibrio sp. JE062 TaxID=439495 RepID=UPI000186C210|nr:hypothetical protein [Pseudovibrio sp. JE062]EEA93040.1 hypothetical protein PJE062_2189 [Pseudovibrio sp. JE062]